MSSIVCEHPRVIMHPRIQELAAKYRCYSMFGKITTLHCRVHPDNISLSRFYPRTHNVNADNIDDCFFIDQTTGETFPMYLLVSCGKCDCCKARKVYNDVYRLQMEAECYDFQPWFVTLTYDEQHVRRSEMRVVPSTKLTDYVRDVDRTYMPSCPIEYVPVGGVNVRDCQLFFKRLRIDLKRAGYDFHIRYYLVSEYSPKKYRPHYHVILFGLNTRTAGDYFKVQDIICKSWQNGFTYARRVNMDFNDKAFEYTTKYMSKSKCQVIPYGCCKNFTLSSKGNGGIGSKFIDTKIRPQLTKTLDVHFQYLSKWTNQVVDLRYIGYVIRRCFPSFCNQVNIKTRKAVRELSTVVRQIYYFNPNHHAITMFQNFRKKYQKYLFIPRFEDYNMLNLKIFHFQRAGGSLLHYFVSQFCRLYRIIKSDLRFSPRYLARVCRQEEVRQKFLSRLFAFDNPVDITISKIKARGMLYYRSPITHYV